MKPTPDPSDGKGKEAQQPPPALRLTDCPNCRRSGVAVFPVIRPDRPDDTVRPVCPHCCPKQPNRS